MIRQTLSLLLEIMTWIILVNVLMSWVPINKNNAFFAFLDMITEPILAPIRLLLNRAFGQRMMMMDFSPIVAFLIIDYVLLPFVRRLPF